MTKMCMRVSIVDGNALASNPEPSSAWKASVMSVLAVPETVEDVLFRYGIRAERSELSSHAEAVWLFWLGANQLRRICLGR